MNPIRELCTLGAKMFVIVGGNSTEKMMFHMSYKQSKAESQEKILEARNSSL